jgi:hypothetical protein
MVDMTTREEDRPDMGGGWLAHFSPSRRLKIAVSILMLILIAFAVFIAGYWCYKEIRRLSAHLKKSQRVHPVSESTFNAANPAPAQV